MCDITFIFEVSAAVSPQRTFQAEAAGHSKNTWACHGVSIHKFCGVTYTLPVKIYVNPGQSIDRVITNWAACLSADGQKSIPVNCEADRWTA